MENNRSKFDFAHEANNPVNLLDRLRFDEDEYIGLDKIVGQVSDKADVATIVLAGGKGSRLLDSKNSLGKQLIKLAGKPVLTWSMDTFDAVAEIGQIVVVAPEDKFKEYIDKVVGPFAFQTPIVMAKAGDSRQESAFNGLEMVADQFKYVIVHDGARPLVPISIVKHLISKLKSDPELDGVICGHPAIDTLKVVEDNVIIGSPERKHFWIAQTPQIFVADKYRHAHKSALTDGFVGTDDASLIERLGGTVEIIEGKRNNIKLTVPEDELILGSVLKALKLRHGSEYNI